MERDRYLYMPSAWVVRSTRADKDYTRIGFEKHELDMRFDAEEIIDGVSRKYDGTIVMADAHTQIEEMARMGMSLGVDAELAVVPILPDGANCSLVREFVALRGWYKVIVVKDKYRRAVEEELATMAREERQAEEEALRSVRERRGFTRKPKNTAPPPERATASSPEPHSSSSSPEETRLSLSAQVESLQAEIKRMQEAFEREKAELLMQWKEDAARQLAELREELSK